MGLTYWPQKYKNYKEMLKKIIKHNIIENVDVDDI